MRPSRTGVVFAAVALLLLARPAHAYLDPASGSMLLQVVLGGAAGAALAVKMLWRRIRRAFGRGEAPPDSTPE